MTRDPSELLGRSVDEPEVRAFLDLHDAVAEDEAILQRTYLSLGRSGVEILVEGERVIHTVFLYGNDDHGKGPYVGRIPFGLTLDMQQSEVRATLGEPEFQSSAQEIKYLGRMGPVERYRLTPCSVHVQYAESDGSIVQITLMTHEATPQTKVVH